LNDFQIRRLKFIQQGYDERVLLWMVVVITLSGVFLAGLQLVGSYRLAAAAGRTDIEQSGEIALQRDRISLKSSITGLFILLVSFAFFYVFVIEIVPLKEVNTDAQLSRQPPEVHKFSSGGLGPPPTPNSPASRPSSQQTTETPGSR